MFRSVITGLCVAWLSGCTITTHSGPSSPERVASSEREPERERPPRPHVPAEPRPSRPDAEPAPPRDKPKPGDVAPTPTKPDPVKPPSKPIEPAPTKPIEPKPTKPVEPKPTKPVEPKPTTPVEPKPTTPVEPKPTTPVEPKPKPVEPKPKPVEPKPKPPADLGIKGFVYGKPAGLQQGLPDAYWVYKDAHGWHLRTTTDNPAIRRFTGSIWVTSGKFSEARASVIEKGDSVKRAPQRIEFNFETIGQMDGIDFDFTDASCVHFELLVDGKPKPLIIFIGAKKVNPPSGTFAICP